MWNILCLIFIMLVGTSHQMIPAFSSIRNGSWTNKPIVHADHIQKQQNITVNNKTLPVFGPSVALQKCPSCLCGITGRMPKIVGGSTTKVNQYPWMAMLKFRGTFNCGASLINHKYVITAAHCINDHKKEDISVRLLEHDQMDSMETKHIDLKVLKVIKHEGYNGISKNNDIALLRLDAEGVEFGIYTGIIPVCLPPEGESFAGYKGWVTGWGVNKQRGKSSRFLQKVRLPILENENCVKTENGQEITNNMMCAGYQEGKMDACQGDSGGPLQVVINSTYYIAGIVSWGKGCALANRPGVYTRVNKYLDWVERNTRDACPCSDPTSR